MELKISGIIYIPLGKLLSVKLHGLSIHFTYEFLLSAVQISSKNMVSMCLVIPALFSFWDHGLFLAYFLF